MPLTYKDIIGLDTEPSLALTDYFETQKSAGVKTKKALLSALSSLIINESEEHILDGLIGDGVIWWRDDDPALYGRRIILLTGQVLTIANYQDLCDFIYCGDGNNPTASAFYKTSDAGGTIRSTSGTYMVMPDLRGYFLRGLDVAAAVDPDGASRDIGHIQDDAFQGFAIKLLDNATSLQQYIGEAAQAVLSGTSYNVVISSSTLTPSEQSIATDGVNGTPRTSSESRSINIACKFGIRY